MKKIIALLLSVMMVAGMCAAFAEDADLVLISTNEAPAAAPSPSVTLRIEGAAETIFYGVVALEENDTVLTVLERTLTAAEIEYTVSDSAYGGKYLSALGGETEATFGGYDGWMYSVNGVSPYDTIDVYALTDGDSILLYYGDMGILLPLITVEHGEDGIVTLIAEADVTTYDEQWNPTVTREPIAGAKLLVDENEYTTDENGKAVLSAEDSAKETVSFQIVKSSEAGLTEVIRFAPGYTLTLKADEAPVETPEEPETPAEPEEPNDVTFSDVTEGWYYESVMNMVAYGAVNGYTDGTFRPMNNITRAEVAVILYRLAGSPEVEAEAVFSDVDASGWSGKAITWASQVGVVKGADGKFSPTANITRQDLAVMLSRFTANVLEKTLPETAEAPAFEDNDAIAAYASEAVYQLQKAGVVNGTDGKFLPRDNASRAVACKMLSGLLDTVNALEETVEPEVDAPAA